MYKKSDTACATSNKTPRKIRPPKKMSFSAERACSYQILFCLKKNTTCYLSTGPSQGNCSKRSTRGRHAGDSARAVSYATTAATMSWCSDAKSSGVGALRRKCPLEKGKPKKQKPPHICNMREMAKVSIKSRKNSYVGYQITDNDYMNN